MAGSTSNGNDRKSTTQATAGKQPIAPVLVRAMTMLSLLPEKPPGVTAQWLRDQLAMHHDGFAVHARTIERNLADLSGYFPITCNEDFQPFRWYWMPRANRQIVQLARRVAAEGGRPHPTPVSEHALSWRPAEEFAQALKVPLEQIIADIQAGTYNGVLLNGRWYVLGLVTLDIPDAEHPERVRLRIAARRDGNRLTAGNEALALDLTYDGNAVSAAMSSLMDPSANAPAEWASVKLGEDSFEVDRTLQGELLAALIQWKIEVELGDLLDKYPPDPA